MKNNNYVVNNFSPPFSGPNSFIVTYISALDIDFKDNTMIRKMNILETMIFSSELLY